MASGKQTTCHGTLSSHCPMKQSSLVQPRPPCSNLRCRLLEEGAGCQLEPMPALSVCCLLLSSSASFLVLSLRRCTSAACVVAMSERGRSNEELPWLRGRFPLRVVRKMLRLRSFTRVRELDDERVPDVLHVVLLAQLWQRLFKLGRCHPCLLFADSSSQWRETGAELVSCDTSTSPQLYEAFSSGSFLRAAIEGDVQNSPLSVLVLRFFGGCCVVLLCVISAFLRRHIVPLAFVVRPTTRALPLLMLWVWLPLSSGELPVPRVPSLCGHSNLKQSACVLRV